MSKPKPKKKGPALQIRASKQWITWLHALARAECRSVAAQVEIMSEFWARKHGRDLPPPRFPARPEQKMRPEGVEE